MTEPALALLELNSIAAGLEAGDAMVKKAPIALILAGTVHPGKYLILITGEVADVEESLAAGIAVGGELVLDKVLLPGVHPRVVTAVRGQRDPGRGEAIGIIETHTAAATILAADAGLKAAEVTLIELRLADGLGGKGVLFFRGDVANVEAAVEYGVKAIAPCWLMRQVVIPAMHEEMLTNLLSTTRFRQRTGGV